MIRVVTDENKLRFGDRGFMAVISLLKEISGIIMVVCQRTVFSEKRKCRSERLNNNLLSSGKFLPADIIIPYIKIEQHVVSEIPEVNTKAENISGDVKAFEYIKIINLFSKNFIKRRGLKKGLTADAWVLGFYGPDALMSEYSNGMG